MAPGTVVPVPPPTSSPADAPVGPGEPGATAPEGTKPLPQAKKKNRKRRSKSQASHQRGNKQTSGHKTGQQAATTRSGKAKRSPKPCPEHQRFARTRSTADFASTLWELQRQMNRVDMAIVPVMETTPINVAPDPLTRAFELFTASRTVAATLGLPEEGCIARVELPFVTATAQDLACLEAGCACPTVPLTPETTPLDAAMWAAGFAPPALPWLTTTALLGSPLSIPSYAPILEAPAPAKTGSIKRPLGCVLSFAQIQERLEEELHLKCSRSTLSRLLAKHELKPWRYQYWIFPTAANFAERAGPILDLYAGYWLGVPLGCDEFVLSLDEKTSIEGVDGCTRHCRVGQVGRRVWSGGTAVVGRCNTWPAGMCIAARCLDAARRRWASRRSIV